MVVSKLKEALLEAQKSQDSKQKEEKGVEAGLPFPSFDDFVEQITQGKQSTPEDKGEVEAMESTLTPPKAAGGGEPLVTLLQSQVTDNVHNGGILDSLPTNEATPRESYYTAQEGPSTKQPSKSAEELSNYLTNTYKGTLELTWQED